MSKRLANLMRVDLENADSYEEWKEIALRKDKLRGLEAWKTKEPSNLYDYQAIRKRVNLYREMREQGDDEGLLFALNEGIHGNMGGMGNPKLYRYCSFGTKQLINDYVEEVSNALVHLASDKVDSISLEDKLEFFHRASHCFGRSALMLSGSGSLFYFHLGVVKALWEQKLLPTVISGSSGGAIVAAVFSANSHTGVEKLFDPEFINMEMEIERDINKKSRWKKPAKITPEEIRNSFARLIPDITFQEAAELTGMHLNISVAAAEKHQTSRLLNDIASPNVLIREALMASCSLPGYFPPVALAARDKDGNRKPYLPHRKWIDGSISDDLPIKRVTRLYGVNHTIVSQTNPVALPFISKESSNPVVGLLKDTLKSTAKQWVLALAKLIDTPTKIHRSMNRMVHMTSSVLAQTYTGDINILPPKQIHNPLQLMKERTNAENLEIIKAGEKSTWPEIERIRIQTKVSLTLEKLISELEEKALHPTKKSKPRKNTR